MPHLFPKGGFSHAECLGVVRWLNEEAVDLLEISGGSYEQTRLLGIPGREADAVRPSTRAREAYFLGTPRASAAWRPRPLMVTGGVRARTGMEAALDSGATDVIGIARPFSAHANVVRQLLDRENDELSACER